MLKRALILGNIIFSGSIAIDIYLPIMPVISMRLGASVGSLQTTLTVYLMAFGLAQLLYGPWSDRVGRKPPLVFGFILFFLGTIICTYAPNVDTLIFGRGLQGFGGAAQLVIVRAIVRDSYEGPEATRLLGFVMAITAISPLLAPLVGSLIAEAFGWRWVFGGLGVLTLFTLTTTVIFLKETHPKTKRLALVDNPLATGLRHIVKDRTFVLFTLLGVFGFAGMFVHIAAGAFVYQQVFGLSPIQFSLVLAANSISFFAAALLSSKITMNIGLPNVLFISTIGYAFSAGAILFLSVMCWLSIANLVAVMFVANGFLGLLIPLAMVHALDNQGAYAGLASSISGTAQMLVGGIVIALFSALSDGSSTSMALGVFCCAILLLATQLTNRFAK